MTPPWVGGGGGNIGFGGRDGGRLYILESYLAYTYVSGRLSGSKPKKYIDSPQNRASNSLQFSRTVRPSEHCGPDRIGPDRIGSRGGEGSSKKSPQPRLVPSRGNVWMSQMGQGHWPRGGREEGSKLLAQASLLLTTVL